MASSPGLTCSGDACNVVQALRERDATAAGLWDPTQPIVWFGARSRVSPLAASVKSVGGGRRSRLDSVPETS